MAQYYYVGSDNKSHGPVDPSQFAELGFNEETLVCPVGGQSWSRVADIPGLTTYLTPQQPPQTNPYIQQPYGQQQYPNNPGMPPSNNLVWAILTTIFCCLPFGIVAIVNASKVNNLWACGQYDAARQAAKNASKWSIIAAIAGGIFSILYILFLIIGIGAASSTYYY